MIIDNPFIFQGKISAQEIFEIRRANEMEYHEARMANLAELHAEQMEAVALEKEYFRKKIAMLNSMYTSFHSCFSILFYKYSFFRTFRACV